MVSAELETNLTTEVEQVSIKAEKSQEVQSNCQGYKVDPITRLHLCQVCPYHKYRNESKPWLK